MCITQNLFVRHKPTTACKLIVKTNTLNQSIFVTIDAKF